MPQSNDPARAGFFPARRDAGPAFRLRSCSNASSLTDLPSLTRRSFLSAGAGFALASAAGLRPAGGAVRGVPFGAAIQSEHFDDLQYRQAFLDHCDMIVPMNELKFGLLRPERDRFDFERADRLVDFALAHGKTSRGHTFVWWSTNPPWLEAIEEPGEAEAVLVDHIETVADHFAGRLTGWDVVNEVIAHEPRGEGGPLRDTFWLRRLGARHIPVAFEAAARADPAARLVVNDYDLEFAGERYDARRSVMLDIVRQLQDGGLKVDCVGIQAHLYSHFSIDVPALARFVEDLKRLGVGLVVTELDVIDFQVPGGVAEQDEAARRIVGDFLDGIAAAPPQAFVTWGITDRYSWVPDVMPREDGKPSRPLPFDAEMKPKPWYDLIRRRLSAMEG